MDIRLSRREVVRLFGMGLVMRHAGSVAAVPKTRIPLPAPQFDGGLSVERVLRGRRSVREYTRRALTLAEVSQLLWAAQGMTHRSGLRTAPSAGALYPLEVYVVAAKVVGLSPAIYRYDPRAHGLSLVMEGDQRIPLSTAALKQTFIQEAAIALVFCAVYRRTTVKYGERGLRYVHMEVGHAAQNVYLQAVSLQLGTVAVGAFQDERVREVIGAATDEEPLCIMPIGRL